MKAGSTPGISAFSPINSWLFDIHPTALFQLLSPRSAFFFQKFGQRLSWINGLECARPVGSPEFQWCSNKASVLLGLPGLLHGPSLTFLLETFESVFLSLLGMLPSPPFFDNQLSGFSSSPLPAFPLLWRGPPLYSIYPVSAMFPGLSGRNSSCLSSALSYSLMSNFIKPQGFISTCELTTPRPLLLTCGTMLTCQLDSSFWMAVGAYTPCAHHWSQLCLL